ncbi:DUF6464 family protein [Synechococcus sp. CCY 9618]|uniref:DUF6464 family protein n=1 Tax=Synechococcus sp. CCY 9618 TaxID=2815602 RepID=UPI001C21EFD7|nr:DUF6464 family protein [Synechococcus sp. CCY 9618]
MRIELRQIDSDRLITTIAIEEPGDVPHPGRWLTLGEHSYLVLQRRHRYQLRQGRYELVTVALQVKPQRQPADALWWEGGWVIGDPQCRFNARSPLLRCAVLPEGPCDRCSHRHPR